ncbi:MAG: Undecaprenyl phosphate-alpha-4-amino-4-deoxy-L-arabinose arabinosyl transferase [candidate division BRC1 bacterium ADurb.BinA364]|nr:MAG: Undecaprenyl phosphate-alpha-4-amino-4-deoxy-L-arabinose arabinosyl transferase [candidate division BRC1 bacterium ADurb.BinA364]
MRLFGVNEFSARFPSMIAGALTALLIYWLALSMGLAAPGARMASLAAATSLLLCGIAKAATTDSVLTLTVVAAMWLHWEQRKRFSWVRHAAFWAVLAASALVKGPPGLAIVALGLACNAAWERWAARRGGLTGSAKIEWRQLAVRGAAGAAIFLALGLPWVVAAWRRTDGEFFRVSVGHHVVDRSMESFEGHGGPIFYYIPVALIGLFPWTALLFSAARWGWARRNEAAIRYCWSWFAPGFLMFSLAATKLPHYIAPLLPALALMIGGWWASGAAPGCGGQPPFPGLGWRRAGAALMGLAGVAAVSAIAVLIAVFDLGRFWLPFGAFGAALALACLGGAAAAWSRSGLAWPRAARIWGWGAVAAYAVLFAWLLPSLEPLRPSKALVEPILRSAPPGTELLALEYTEPCLFFYWGAPVRIYDEGESVLGIGRLANASRPAALVAEAERWQRWRERYGRLRGGLPEGIHPLLEGRYFQLQHGEWLDLVVVTNWTKAGEASGAAEAMD